MYNLYHAYKTDGKKTYLIEYRETFTRFNNDEHLRNGYEKALAYCEKNNIPKEEIKQFDSVLESYRYEYLRNEEMHFLIKNLSYHKVITLIPSFVNANGDTIPEQTYNADFTYYDNIAKRNIVEDVKGRSLFEDTRFELAKALFDSIYLKNNLYIRIIIADDFKAKTWKEWHIGELKKPRKLIKKQSATIKEQAKALHDIEIAENKKQREIETYKKLSALKVKTKQQEARLVELENILKTKGVIL